MGTLVTAKGREVTVNQLRATGTEPKVIGWGTGTQTAATTDVAPFIESAETRVTGTSSVVTTTTTNDTYQVTGTITSLGTQAITEAFLSDSSTKPFSTTWATAPTTTSGTTGTLAASYTPANNTYVQCEGEVMQVTAGSGTTSVTVTRAANGSTAATHANGTTVTLGNAPGTSTANATLYVHSSFGALNLAANDSVSFTFQVKYS